VRIRLDQIRAWKDIAMFAVAFLASFWLNSIRGILICLALAAYECLSRITAPSLMVLGRDSKGEFHDIKEFTDSRPIEGVSILRVVSPVLFFGNIDQLRNIISLVERLGDPSKLPTSVSQLSHVINVIVLDLAYIIEVDKSYVVTPFLSLSYGSVSNESTWLTFLVRNIVPSSR